MFEEQNFALIERQSIYMGNQIKEKSQEREAKAEIVGRIKGKVTNAVEDLVAIKKSRAEHDL